MINIYSIKNYFCFKEWATREEWGNNPVRNTPIRITIHFQNLRLYSQNQKDKMNLKNENKTQKCEMQEMMLKVNLKLKIPLIYKNLYGLNHRRQNNEILD